MGPNQSVSDVLSALELGAGLQVVSLLDAVLVLLASLANGLFIYWVYRATFDGVVYSRRYNLSLIVLNLVTSFVIMVITSSLILSLGLVGALSIVRFRTAVKEPMDIVFMFWAISAGIAIGAGFYIICVVSSVFIGIVVLALHYLKRPFDPRRVVALQFDPEVRRSIIDVLVKAGKFRITSEMTTGESAEIFAEIRSRLSWDDLTGQLQAIQGVRRVSSVTYDRDAEI